jgi:alpha-L-fucosidase 2
MRYARQLAGICLSLLLATSPLGAEGDGKDGASMKKPDGTKEAHLTTARASRDVSPLADPGGTVPAHGTASVAPARKWEDAFVSGNGRLGAMVFGDPAKETIIGDHCRLFLPLGSREIVPDLAKYLPELRQVIRTKGYGEAMKFFLGKAKEQGFPGLIWTDPFHPGFFLTVEQPPAGDVTDYVRTEDFTTGEVAVRWKDGDGQWSRRLFVSRPDNAIVLSIVGPGGGKVNCTLRPEKVGESRIGSTRKVEAGWATYHNVYQYGKGGFDVAIRVAPKGGKMSRDDESIHVEGADSVLVLMRIAPWKIAAEGSDAWAYNPKHPDFVADKLGVHVPAPAGADSSVTAYPAADDAKALLEKVKASLAELPADCDRLFEKHVKAHRTLFDRVTLDLGGGADRQRTSEQLLDTAQKDKRLPPALLEKMFDAGRYMFICSAGERTPNLQGIWTGSWKPAWSGDYTTDTNVQLAMKVAYSGNLLDLMEGYYRLMEEALPDWRLNAKRYYGCRGVLAPTRMSNNGLMLHWGGWDGIWWTAGAGWLAHFFTDGYHYTGDREFLAKRVVPLLKEVVAFYEDFMTVDPKTGLYEFIPSYSPESGDGITSTMDVMVAREALTSLIEACQTLNVEPQDVARWKGMLAKLPAYRINKDGALAEWVPDGPGEHYGHRHLSHLHAAYEATGELLGASPEILRAAQEATRRRIDSGGEQSTHGRMHMGLSAAHLRMAEEAYGRLAIMATLRSIFPSLICGHEPGPAIFNTDGNGAIPEIVCRMLLASLPGRLDLLPALPAELPKGEIRGILARQAIHFEKLAWNRPAGTVELWMTSSTDQTVALHMPGAKAMRSVEAQGATVRNSPQGPLAREVTLKAGQAAKIAITFE